MNQRNLTTVSYFTMKGISDRPDLQTPIFLLVLLMYIAVLFENSIISLLITLDHRLHTPMYFFLFNLSALDIFYTTVTLHKTLGIYISGINRISFNDCMTQMYLYITGVCNELLIVTAMSFDCYVAICNPLHYSLVMNKRVCGSLAGVCWAVSAMEGIPHTYIMSGNVCFKSIEINHFLCEILAVMKLTCTEHKVIQYLMVVDSIIFGMVPLIFTLITYVFIIKAILRIHSKTGRKKAFYTCSSHFTVVIILYVTVFCLYTNPTSSTTSSDSDKLLSLLYIVVTPILNPLIYSLKNQDIKKAWKTFLSTIRKTLNVVTTEGWSSARSK